MGYGATAYTRAAPVPVTPGEDYYFRSPRVVASNVNEVRKSAQSYLNGGSSLKLRATMSTKHEDITPVIDLTRVNALLTHTLIDEPDANDARFGALMSTITTSVDSELVAGNYLYRAASTTATTGSIHRIMSYNATHKTAYLKRVDGGVSVPEVAASYVSKPASAASTLNGGINDSTTSVVVASAVNLAVNNTIQVDDEFMKITGIATNTLTVVRGVLGSTAASHLTAASVYKMIQLGAIFPTSIGTVDEVKIHGAQYYSPETVSSTGCGMAKFVSIPFKLENPSDGMDMTLTAFLFSTGNLKCYYRTRGENDTARIANMPWVPFNGTGLSDNYQLAKVVDLQNLDPDELTAGAFFEYKFSARNVKPYIEFQVKFCMTQTNPALSPIISDYRIVCSV